MALSDKATRQEVREVVHAAVDGFIGRIDDYETEQVARDAQFERLLVWARRVSVQTGIPLENL